MYPLTVLKPEIRDWGGPSEVAGESLLPSLLLPWIVCFPSLVSWTCRSSTQSPPSSVYGVLPGCLPVSKLPLFIRTFVVVLQSLSSVQLSWDSWTVACQAPLSMGFSRQEYWSGLPLPTPGFLPYPGSESASPAWQVESSPLSLLGSALTLDSYSKNCIANRASVCEGEWFTRFFHVS